MSLRLPCSPSQAPNRKPHGGQFSLRWLFGLMLLAAFLLGAPQAMGAVGGTAAALLILSIPLVTLEVAFNTERCPAGAWVHVAGMLVLALSVPMLCLPMLSLAMCTSGVLMMASGAVSALEECRQDRLPEESVHVAWAAVANAALFGVVVLAGAGWALLQSAR